MLKSQLVVASYNHLAEGSDESSFEDRYQVAWRPFLSVLYRFPDLAATLHYSGTVLRWLEARHPEFLMLLEEMAARKQVELLGGGFFAPLFPLIAGQDRLGQVELLTTYIRKAFGKRPRGCWIQDYAWDSGLASQLQACGFEYCFLSEHQFRLAGLVPTAPAVSEDQGKCISVFPAFDAAESFERPLPFAEAAESLLSRLGESSIFCLSYSDECARELWLGSGLESPDVFYERSFAALQRESLRLETTTPSRWLKASRSGPRAYFPGSASRLLMRRSLESPDPAAPPIGSPRRLLLRYEESSALYSKMQYVRILVSQLRGDKSRKKNAQEELWKAQCGEAYWHSREGGILRLPVRAAAYASLIEAEKTTRQGGGFVPGLIRADLDFDGEKEVLYQGADFNAYLHLRGASLVEFDSMRSRRNYVNVCRSPSLEPALDSAAAVSLPKPLPGLSGRCFLDRVFDPASAEPWRDRAGLHEAPFSLVESQRPLHHAVLQREAGAEIGGRRRAFLLRKSFSFRKGSLGADYELVGKEEEAFSLRLATEFHLAASFDYAHLGISAGLGHERRELAVSAPDFLQSASSIRLDNRRDAERLELRADSPASLIHEPVRVIVEGTRGREELYQGCRLVFYRDLVLEPGKSTGFSISLELGKA